MTLYLVVSDLCILWQAQFLADRRFNAISLIVRPLLRNQAKVGPAVVVGDVFLDDLRGHALGKAVIGDDLVKVCGAAVGQDRPGLANAVAGELHRNNCTIVDARMDTVGAYFAMLIQFSGQASDVERVRQEAKGWGPKHNLTIETYEDHRMAMAFSIAGLAVEGIVIRDADCVSKSFPGFFETLASLARSGR